MFMSRQGAFYHGVKYIQIMNDNNVIRNNVPLKIRADYVYVWCQRHFFFGMRYLRNPIEDILYK